MVMELGRRGLTRGISPRGQNIHCKVRYWRLLAISRDEAGMFLLRKFRGLIIAS